MHERVGWRVKILMTPTFRSVSMYLFSFPLLLSKAQPKNAVVNSLPQIWKQFSATRVPAPVQFTFFHTFFPLPVAARVPSDKILQFYKCQIFTIFKFAQQQSKCLLLLVFWKKYFTFKNLNYFFANRAWYYIQTVKSVLQIAHDITYKL
jgi:hypothetical protein